MEFRPRELSPQSMFGIVDFGDAATHLVGLVQPNGAAEVSVALRLRGTLYCSGGFFVRRQDVSTECPKSRKTPTQLDRNDGTPPKRRPHAGRRKHEITHDSESITKPSDATPTRKPSQAGRPIMQSITDSARATKPKGKTPDSGFSKHE